MTVFKQTNIVFCLKSEFLQTLVHFFAIYVSQKVYKLPHKSLCFQLFSMGSAEHLPFASSYCYLSFLWFGASSPKELYIMDETYFTYIFNGKIENI